MSIREFLTMGGYAAYVWPSYGFTALVFAWMIAGARKAHRDALATARKRLATARSGS
jgi:heme exporter protein D